MEKSRFTKWSQQGRKKSKFKRDKSDCDHWMVYSDINRLDKHCEYCGYAKYYYKSKPLENGFQFRSVANED